MIFLQAEGAQGQTSLLPTLLVWVLLLVMFYVLLIRPQQQQQKRRREMLSKLRKGDRVVTVGGLHATITDMQDDVLTLELAPNVRVRADRAAVASVRSRRAEGEAKEAKAKSG